ncbi:ABC transporter substrate-binding protein [Paenibacillus daejeonensis]|uniref:ABC transporter substrate-binding protein n=1 Tax=Paenibacillus daejeonensis TaxID=135193 RepID=UPI00036876DD|nr:sugar ABC transporter substrate-binding protein [Paenibacillus daejeonensis]
MKNRMLRSTLVMMLSLAVMTACTTNGGNQPENGQNDPPQPPQPTETNTNTGEVGDEVTLRYAVWDANQANGLRVMADEFEAANAGIKIDIEVVGWSDYWTMLEAGATGGSLPDVFWMHSNEIYRYASNGMLMNLNTYIESSDQVDLSKFPQGIVDIYNFQGNQYGVPKDFDTIGLWYNKTLFDEAGVGYPDESWTWDDLYDAAKALTKDGVYGILAPLHNQEGYYNFVYQNGGTIITDDKQSGYDDPKTIEALEYYVRFVREGLSPEVYGDAERAEAIQNGLAAMGFFGSWNLSGFTANNFMAEHFDVAVLPKQERQASIYNGLAHAIAHNTEHPEEAWTFTEYLGSKEGQERHAELGIAISAYEGAADLWVSSNDTFNVKAFVDMVAYGVIRPYSNTTIVWEDRAYESLRAAFTGDVDVEEAASNAASAMNQILAEE